MALLPNLESNRVTSLSDGACANLIRTAEAGTLRQRRRSASRPEAHGPSPRQPKNAPATPSNRAAVGHRGHVAYDSILPTPALSNFLSPEVPLTVLKVGRSSEYPLDRTP